MKPILVPCARGGAIIAAVAAASIGACSGNDSTQAGCAKRTTWPVAINSPQGGGIVGTGQQLFVAQVPTHVAYSISISGVNDRSASLTLYANGCFDSPMLPTITGTSPEELHQFVLGDSIWFGVTAVAGGGVFNVVTFTALVTPMAAPGPTHSESLAVSRDAAVLGQVGAGGTSHYWTPGLIPGIPYAVSIVALNDDAVLHVFTDSTYSQELDCTRLAAHVPGAAQECISFSDGRVSFTVESGAAAASGARYDVLVTRD